jgi:hypothetical protein
MARMGYVVGQGLGKNSDGRAEPVPIQLLPQGKRLQEVDVLFSFYPLAPTSDRPEVLSTLRFGAFLTLTSCD